MECKNVPTRCVAPGFIVRREDTQMAAPDKLIIVHTQQRVGGIEELRVKYNL